MSSESIRIIRSDKSSEQLHRWLYNLLPDDNNYRLIFVKPNWVFHETCSDFPIQALVTATELLDKVIQICLDKYVSAEQIMIGDVPLQTCEWDKMIKQANIDNLIAKYANQPKVIFRDLRKERFIIRNGFFESTHEGDFGDPRGYREVVLDEESCLNEISERHSKFAVQDYPKTLTRFNHRKKHHRYLISASVLESDLFINLPKMKTHQKAGITGALKNLVGINGDKAYLVHHREGKKGDEFGPNSALIIRIQTRAREIFQKRFKYLFISLRKGWIIFKKLKRIETKIISDSEGKTPYIGSGAWYGNDTIWRMIYDLNKIIIYAPKDGGRIALSPQRDYVAIVDGTIAGEGNGPLQPLPVNTKVLIGGNNPFWIDMVMAKLMGFDWKKIPSLSNYRKFYFDSYTSATPEEIPIVFDQKRIMGIKNLSVLKRFDPPPGWKGYIEREK